MTCHLIHITNFTLGMAQYSYGFNVLVNTSRMWIQTEKGNDGTPPTEVAQPDGLEFLTHI